MIVEEIAIISDNIYQILYEDIMHEGQNKKLALYINSLEIALMQHYATICEVSNTGKKAIHSGILVKNGPKKC